MDESIWLRTIRSGVRLPPYSILNFMDRFSLHEQWSKFQKTFLFKKRVFFYYFLDSSCSFYLGFICGNIFGTFLIFLRNRVIWDGVLFFFLIVFFEILNFFIYKQMRFRLLATFRDFSKSLKGPPTRSVGGGPALRQRRIVFILKNFQTGILFGFFIDAFKVGS